MAAVDGNDYMHSFSTHQCAARRVAIGNGRTAPPPKDSPSKRDDMIAVAVGAFVAGLCAAVLIVLTWRIRGWALGRLD